MSDESEHTLQPGGDSEYSRALIEAISAAIPAWVARTITTLAAGSPQTGEPELSEAIGETTHRMLEATRDQLTRLLADDVEAQRGNPLQVLRREAIVVTDALRRLGVKPPRRDDFDRAAMPEDIYGIGPLTWRDLGDEVHEAGIMWGAWKAATVMTRHKAGGEST